MVHLEKNLIVGVSLSMGCVSIMISECDARKITNTFEDVIDLSCILITLIEIGLNVFDDIPKHELCVSLYAPSL